MLKLLKGYKLGTPRRKRNKEHWSRIREYEAALKDDNKQETIYVNFKHKIRIDGFELPELHKLAAVTNKKRNKG